MNPTQAPKIPTTNPSPDGWGKYYFWWILLGFLVLWNLASPQLWPKEPLVAKLPYSVFIDQVKAGNVDRISIAGGEIKGAFEQPFEWPAHAGAPASASPQSGTKTTPPARTSASTSSKEPPATATPPPKLGAARESRPSRPPQPSPRREKYGYFITTFPEAIGDPNLLPLLEKHHVEIVAEAPHSAWLGAVLFNLLPMILLIGFFWWMGRRAVSQQNSVFGFGKKQARRYDPTRSAVTFADVAGADAAKQQLQEEVAFLREPDKFHALGARIPRGILLVGLPGTGKTLLARAVAGEAQVSFFSISGSEFVEMFVGVGASRVRDLFRQVKAAAPAILFVDELDAVGRRRGAGLGMVNDEREQTLNQLLVEMDGFDERQDVIVLAATNRPDVLDPALLRPGRFDRQIVVSLPDRRGREGILEIHTRKLKIADDVKLPVLAQMTTGMSGAQLANLCNEAALVAAGRDHAQIQMVDFEGAMDKIILGDKRALALDEAARRVIAYHEGGHALVAWLTPDADPVHKVTIVPHGQALGVTEQRPGEDRYNYSKRYLLARLAVMLGGRTAEELALGEVTTGAENDLIEATRLARRMVSSWGMSDLGLAAYESSGEDRFLGYDLGRSREYSDETARRIDEKVLELLDESQAEVRKLLTTARAKLNRLAGALLEHETVDYDELARLLGPPAATANAA